MDAIYFTNKLVELTRDISLEVGNVFIPILSKYDLTLIQLQILRGIRDNNNLHIGTLAKEIHLQSGNTSTTCKQLEKKGFLVRNRDLDDERVVTITITNKGLDTLEEIDNTVKSKYSNICNENPEVLDSILLGLSNLSDVLSKMNNI